jgi:hypothetical protein
MSDSETRGILTEADKEWLRGDKEYEQRQSAAKRRAQIRDRVTAAMQDFSLLIDNWSEEERTKAMDEIDLEQCGAEMIAFLYLAANDSAQNPELLLENGSAEEALKFRRALSQGIKQGKEGVGSDPPATVLLDANTKLFELPPEDELQRSLDTDDWRAANEYTRGAANKSDDTVIDKDEAQQDFRIALTAEIMRVLSNRRHRSDSEIKRHERHPGSTGLL